MKKSILNLEGVQVLSVEEQKNVNGGGRRNCELTGNTQILTSYDTSTQSEQPVTEVCEWKCDKTFLGVKVGTTTVWGGCSVWG